MKRKIRPLHVFAVIVWSLALGIIALMQYEHHMDDPDLLTLHNVSYFRDPRILDQNICFATLSRRTGRGLARIPCDKIPPHLIKTLKVEE